MGAYYIANVESFVFYGVYVHFTGSGASYALQQVFAWVFEAVFDMAILVNGDYVGFLVRRISSRNS